MNEYDYSTIYEMHFEPLASGTANSWVDARCFLAVCESKTDKTVFYCIDLVRRNTGKIVDRGIMIYKNGVIAFLNRCHKKADTRKYTFKINGYVLAY